MTSFSASFTLPITKHLQCPHYVYDYSKVDGDGLLDHLLDVYFANLYAPNDIEFAWSSLKYSTDQATCHYIPKVLIQSHQHPEWFTPEIQPLLKQDPFSKKKIQIFSLSIHLSKKDLIVQKFYFRRKWLLLNIHTSKTWSTSWSAFNNDNKIFSYINNITSHNLIPTIVHLNSITASSDSNKASLFNKYFNSRYAKSVSFTIPPINIDLSNLSQTLCNINFSELDVYNVLASLNPR